MRFLNGNVKAQKIIFELKPRPLLARLRYVCISQNFPNTYNNFRLFYNFFQKIDFKNLVLQTLADRHLRIT